VLLGRPLGAGLLAHEGEHAHACGLGFATAAAEGFGGWRRMDARDRNPSLGVSLCSAKDGTYWARLAIMGLYL
jgi:hypothetical protein